MAKYTQLIVTLGLCVLYLLQSAFEQVLPKVETVQQIDGVRTATGVLLIVFIAYQWYLSYRKLTGQSIQNAARWHGNLGALAPVLLYLHSASLGYAYLFVLSLLFVLNTMVGAIAKVAGGSAEQRRLFQSTWLIAHVPSSCLITVLALMHMVYAFAYG